MAQQKYSSLRDKPYYIVLDVLNFTTSEPATPNKGDVYVNTTAGNSSVTTQALTAFDVVTWNGTDWSVESLAGGEFVYNETGEVRYTFDGTALVPFSGGIADWAATTSYSIGNLVLAENRTYRRITGGTSAASFDLDRANWEVIVPLQAISPWSAATYYYEGDTLNVHGRIFRCNTSHTSDAGNFGVDELANWDRVDNINSSLDYQGNFYYYTGEQITTNKKIYRRIASGTSSLLFDATEQLNWEIVSDEIVRRLTATETNVAPGYYEVDTTAGAFTLSLQQVVGKWHFLDPNFTLQSNAVTIDNGVGQSFTDEAGVQQSSALVYNSPGYPFIITNTDGTNVYKVSSTQVPPAPKAFLPNGGWDAATNTPDLNTVINRVNGNEYYVYNITNTGTVNLGSGATLYEAGGEITFYSTTSFRYDAPNTVLNFASAAEIETGTDTTKVLNSLESSAVFIKKSVANAKGDILVATANDVLTVLPSGTNNQILTADTATASGLKWVDSKAWSTSGNTSTAANILGSTDNTAVKLQSGTANLTINEATTGNVGIGTATPTTKLHIVSTATSLMTAEGNNTNAIIEINNTNASATNYTGVRMNKNGVEQWLIGTSGVNANGDFAIRRPALVPFTILQSNGNIGINTTTPTAKLHVNGTFTTQTPLVKSNQAANFAISVADVDAASMIMYNQSTPGISITSIASPSSTTMGRFLRIHNFGTAALTYLGDTIKTSTFLDLHWNGATWAKETSNTVLDGEDYLAATTNLAAGAINSSTATTLVSSALPSAGRYRVDYFCTADVSAGGAPTFSFTAGLYSSAGVLFPNSERGAGTIISGINGNSGSLHGTIYITLTGAGTITLRGWSIGNPVNHRALSESIRGRTGIVWQKIS